MANKKYEETDVQAIAIAIREKTETDNTYNIQEMASGVGEVFEAGKQAEYNTHWDVIQNYGTRRDYSKAFLGWNCEEIIPKYKIVPNKSVQMFSNTKIKRINKEFFDLSQAVYSDTSTNSAGYGLCDSCRNLEIFPDIGLQAGFYAYAFSECESLHTIEVLRVNENTLIQNTAFRVTPKLANIIVEGVIGKNFDIHWSPLSIASLKNIIKHLKDYAPGDEANHFKYTLTVKASAWDALVESGFTDDDYSWILSTIGLDSDSIEEFGYTWTEIVGALCWNLTLAS